MTGKARIIRYVRFSVNKDRENHFRELLLLFHPFRTENDLLFGKKSYELAYHLKKHIVEANRIRYEPFREQIEKAVEDLEIESNEMRMMETTRETFLPSTAPYDDEDIDIGNTTITHVDEDDNLHRALEIIIPASLSHDEYLTMVSSLNDEQQSIFFDILCRARECLFGSGTPWKIAFVSGGAGSGKSYLLKCLFQALYRLYESPLVDPTKPTVAIVAYTGVAARNVNGMTIHSLLGLKIGSNPNDVKSQISNSSLQDYRTKLRFLKVLLIDEISYVGNRFLYCIDERLRQIFMIDRPFGGVYVIFFGDLYQLKPVRDGPIFKKLTVRDLDKGAFYDSPWFSCELFTLKKIVRQSEPEWIYLLNLVRLGTFTIGDLSEINTLVDNPIPPTAHRACKTNKLVNKHNDEEMAKCSHIVEVYADEFIRHGADIPTEIQSQLIHKARRMDKTTTASMLFKIDCAIDQRYMITININKSDGLLNGTVGILRKLSYRDNKVEIMWLEIADETVGAIARTSFIKTHPTLVSKGWTPITRIVKDFNVSLSARKTGDYRVEWRQFPLVHAQAITIHKFQGKTEDNLCIDFGESGSSHGLAYVALSRCRTKKGNCLMKPITDKEIVVSSDVIDEMARLNEKGYSLSYFIPESTDNSIKVLFHNVQSLRAHFKNIKNCIFTKQTICLFFVRLG